MCTELTKLTCHFVMSLYNESPNFTLEGVSNCEGCKAAITALGEVRRGEIISEMEAVSELVRGYDGIVYGGWEET